jgi:xylose isomerase
MSTIFDSIAPIRHEGTASTKPLAFRHYDPTRVVLGKTMAEHLRFAVCYWHTFCWDGNDPFGGQTLLRPWFEAADPLRAAEQKAEAAFDFFAKLGAPYFCFHDRDVAPEGATPRESKRHLDHMVERLQGHMQRTGVKLLWGTANLFSHRRYMSGAATNPEPAVFAFAAAQVKEVLEATHRMGGENYVLWGGREGYETLLNTNLGHEDIQAGRFLNLVVEHKHKIGFKGTILIEPKPREPTKHQYDFDSATVHAFLQRHGLEKEVKLNIESNHATLAGHSFEHELAYAVANGIFGSVDMNRGDPQLGWDTDQFPNSVAEVALALYTILQGGGFTTGGINFDAKIRRQSIDAEDLFHGHIGGMDTCANGLLVAAAMIEDGALAGAVRERYAGWETARGQDMLAGKVSLADLSAQVLADDREVAPRSGRQEMFENLVRRYL